MSDWIDDGVGTFDHIKIKKIMQYMGLENEKLYDIAGTSDLGDWRENPEGTIKDIHLRDVLKWIGVEDASNLRRAGSVTIGELVEPPVLAVAMSIFDPFKLNACCVAPVKIDLS